MAQNLTKPAPDTSAISNPRSMELLRHSVAILDGWGPHQTLPQGLSSTMLAEAISEATRRLNPVTPERIIAGMGLLAKHGANFNIPMDGKAIAETFRLMCRTMPGDLFERGLVEALQTSTDTYRLPMPGRIWELVQKEYDRRKRDLGRLETAQKFGRHDEPVPIEERVSAESLDELMASVRKNLKQVAA